MSQAEDLRSSERKRTLKKGVIAFNGRYCSANCTVRNESDHGALLVVSDNHLIPAYIELNVYPNQSYRPAQVMWRTPDAMGVRYMDIDDSQAPEVPQDVKPEEVVREPAFEISPAPQPPTWDGVERRLSGLSDRRR